MPSVLRRFATSRGDWPQDRRLAFPELLGDLPQDWRFAFQSRGDLPRGDLPQTLGDLPQDGGDLPDLNPESRCPHSWHRNCRRGAWCSSAAVHCPHGNVCPAVLQTFQEVAVKRAERGIGQWSTLHSAAPLEVTPLRRQVRSGQIESICPVGVGSIGQWSTLRACRIRVGRGPPSCRRVVAGKETLSARRCRIPFCPRGAEPVQQSAGPVQQGCGNIRRARRRRMEALSARRC